VGGPGVQRKIARAAQNAHVKRFVPWQFGVDYDVIGRNSPQDLFDEQLDVRDMLRAQPNTEWVIVSTGMFTSFLFEPAFGVVDLAANTVNALGSWDTAVTLTTADDIGNARTETPTGRRSGKRVAQVPRRIRRGARRGLAQGTYVQRPARHRRLRVGPMVTRSSAGAGSRSAELDS
jgi:hypothetical protein